MKLSVLCYVKNNGRTLMLFRNRKSNDPSAGKWNGVGGKMELNESPEEAVVREVREETGLTINNFKLKGIITFPETKRDEAWYVFVFVADKWVGNLIECNEGELSWVEDSKILSLNLWPGDRVFLPLLENNGLFSVKIQYNKDNEVASSVVHTY